MDAGRAEFGFEEPRLQPADAVVVRDGPAYAGTASHGRVPGGKVSRLRVVVVAAQASTAATSSVLPGNTTAAGSAGSSPRARRRSDRDQQSIARSRSVAASVTTAPSRRRRSRESRLLTARMLADRGSSWPGG